MMIDREAERDQLRRAVDEAPQLVVMRGRRRIGKSYLINAALADRPLIYFQADEGDARSHLDLLAHELGSLLGAPIAFSDWDQALTYLGVLTETAPRSLGAPPLAVALDEYQWMQAAQPDLDSKIMRHFDRWKREGVPLTLILSGSALSLMEKLIEGDRPMYGRASYRPLLEAFDYRVAAELAPEGCSNEERVRRYAVLGGTPQYQVWAGKEPLRTVLRKRILAVGTSLSEEPMELIRGEDEINEPGNYYALMRAIASGASHHNEIKQRAQVSSGQLVTQRLNRLAQLRYIERREPVGGNGTPRWTLSDPFFAFWFRYVYPNRSRLQMGRVEEALADIEGDLDNYMGPMFEAVCRQWASRYCTDEAFAQATQIGSYWTRKHDLEVDIVARRRNKFLALGSCKWSQNAETGDLEALRDAQSRIPGAGRADLYLFARGFRASLRKVAARESVTLVDLEDLFA